MQNPGRRYLRLPFANGSRPIDDCDARHRGKVARVTEPSQENDRKFWIAE
jgi:hypothetical protein